MSIEQQALALADDPHEFFDGSMTKLGSLPRAEMDALQLAGVQARFGQLRDKIPMLKKLADELDIHEINELNDVVPLLFEHTMYKSYPVSLLEKGKFTQMNRWLNKLTSHDLSSIDVSECRTIDDWLKKMWAESPMAISSSSGTTGTMSFLPRSADERDILGKTMLMTNIQEFGDHEPDPAEIHAIFPNFRRGYTPVFAMNELIVKHICKGEERFHAAFKGTMSQDVMFLAARIRAAQANGTLDRLEISDDLMARKREFEKLEAEMPQHQQRFFEEKFEELRGKRIYTQATWNMLHGMAKEGLARGEKGMFAPNSIVFSGGGAKGLTPPDGWERDVCEFIGVDRLKTAYGMSEVASVNTMCKAGKYHLNPWNVPFLLDPDDSGIVLPRQGRQTGRAAFFGLVSRHAWGGFISGDEITVNWDEPCACGQTTYYVEPTIQRFSDKTGEDDKITCAATAGAHKEAMSFLSSFE